MKIQIPIIDGHNDTLQFLYDPTKSGSYDFFKHNDVGHVDLPRAAAGGLAGGFFAIFVPDPTPEAEQPAPVETETGYNVPFPAAIDPDLARTVTAAAFTALHQLAQAAPAAVKIVATVADLEACLADGRLGIIPHIEGAAAIEPDLSNLQAYYDLGLRSLGPVWSRPNAFGAGVPFRFPHGPDTGPGLTDAGRSLISACNKMGILVDVSHLNEKGFWDVAAVTNRPIVATHAGVCAICPSTRNLTDAQIDAIGASGGLIGVNFHVPFFRPDGRREPDTPLSLLADHVVYIADRIGIEHVALGSDFDGAMMPALLADAAGLPRLIEALRDRGFDEAGLRHIAHENWLRILRQTWHS